MPRRTLGNLIVLGLALAVWFPAAAQAQEVILLTPENGKLIYTNGASGGSLTLDWQDYSGALSYRVSYAREDQPTPVTVLVTGASQYGIPHRGNRTLAVGACDVNRAETVLGIAQLF